MFQFFVSIFFTINFSIQCSNTYSNEYRAFKNSDAYKTMFHKDAHQKLKQMQRDIEVYKELSTSQRMIRFFCFFFESVIVTKNNMPQLFEYIDDICKKNDIERPAIFIATNQNFLNAFAQKLLTSSGAIVIGQRMLVDSSDKELEAVIAHEIGHIKYNHVNKIVALKMGSYFGTYYLAGYILNHYFLPKMNEQSVGESDIETNAIQNTIVKAICTNVSLLSLWILPNLIINKRFEKEADDFAYRIMDNGDGLKQFFDRLQNIEKGHDAQFDETYEKIKDAQPNMAYTDYLSLMARYYVTKGSHYGFKWLYYNTPYGAHPSPASRIKTIEEYQLKKQAA